MPPPCGPPSSPSANSQRASGASGLSRTGPLVQMQYGSLPLQEPVASGWRSVPAEPGPGGPEWRMKSHWVSSGWSSCELFCGQRAGPEAEGAEPEAEGAEFGTEGAECSCNGAEETPVVRPACPGLIGCRSCVLFPDWLADRTRHQSWAGVLEYLVTGRLRRRNKVHQAPPLAAGGRRQTAGRRGMAWRTQMDRLPIATAELLR